MSEKKEEKKSGLSEFFKTYPRLLPFIGLCVLVVGLCMGMYFLGYSRGNVKTDAEIAYDNQVWESKAAKERAIAEDLNNKYTITRAETEKKAAQLRKEAAELDAEAYRIRSEAEATANTTVSESLTEDLMTYFSYRISLLGEVRTEEKNENLDSVQHSEGDIPNP